MQTTKSDCSEVARMEKQKKAKEAIDFYKFSDLKKKLLIVNAVSIRNQATPYMGYAEMLGIPLVIISALTARFFDFENNAFLIFILAITLVFYFGMHLFLRKMEKVAEKNYLAMVNFYRKNQQRKFINGVFWGYFICYYALSALVAFVLFYFGP